MALQEENKKLRQQFAELRVQEKDTFNLPNSTRVFLPNTAWDTFSSSFNGQKHTIKISFSRGYENESVDYPVLHVSDAETNFGGICYIVQRLIKDKLIPPLLVVGIAYETDYRTFYKLRSRDLTPVEDKELSMGGATEPDPTGGAEAFSNFLSSELFFFVESTYRAKQDNRALYGHSYGGLFGS